MESRFACPFCASGRYPDGGECLLCAGSGLRACVGDTSKPGEARRPFVYLPDCGRLRCGVGPRSVAFKLAEVAVSGDGARVFVLDAEADELTRLVVLVPRIGPGRCDCAGRGGRLFRPGCEHARAVAALVAGGWCDLPRRARTELVV